MLKHTHIWGLEITQNANIFQRLFHIAGHLLNSVIWMALMASVYYGIPYCCSSMWMLELAIQGDVCKGGVIETKETHIKTAGPQSEYGGTHMYIPFCMCWWACQVGWRRLLVYELCLSRPNSSAKLLPFNHSSLPSLVGSAFWENSSIERRFHGAVFWGVVKPCSYSCPCSHFLHLLSIWSMFIYG